MNIYLTHSTNYDYVTELYTPLRQLPSSYTIRYPHEKSSSVENSLDIIQNSDLILAEVSYPSTGQGIELGWADAAGIPIVCFYKSGSKISGGLHAICNDFIEYSSADEMVERISSTLKDRVSAV